MVHYEVIAIDYLKLAFHIASGSTHMKNRNTCLITITTTLLVSVNSFAESINLSDCDANQTRTRVSIFDYLFGPLKEVNQCTDEQSEVRQELNENITDQVFRGKIAKENLGQVNINSAKAQLSPVEYEKSLAAATNRKKDKLNQHQLPKLKGYKNIQN